VIYYAQGIAVGEDFVCLGGDSLWTLPIHCGSVSAAEEILPGATALLSAHPNPFNPHTRVRFALASAGPVRVTVHDVTGRLVARLAEGFFAAGEHELIWRGNDLQGRAVSSGVYLLRLDASGLQASQKLVLLR
jgi:hypothetical protein